MRRFGSTFCNNPCTKGAFPGGSITKNNALAEAMMYSQFMALYQNSLREKISVDTSKCSSM